MDDASPAPPPPGSSPGIERKLSPGVLLLIAILAMVFFIFGLLNLLAQNLLRLRRARRRRRRVGDALAATAAADGSSPTAFQGELRQLFHLHDAGVDQAFIDALPVFPYRAVVRRGATKDHDGGEAFDCAVCLCEFADDDKLRLLPTCGHAFHVPCIDAWLLSHSTCPLCRGSILAAEADYSYSSLSPPPSASPSLLLLHHHSYGLAETTVARDDGGDCDPGARDGDDESPPKETVEEIVEVKLGKLRCVDGGNASARDLAHDGRGSSNGGSGSLGQRRCLSMGSYEYVMDDHAALRVTIKATPKRRPASALRSSRRRHALSACDLGGCAKKAGAWETAVTEAAAASDGRCCGDGAASLSIRDSFSTSKIWMASSVARREEYGRRHGPAAEPAAAGERRAASFRWPAMASGCKRHRRDAEEPCDVEAGGSGDSAVSSLVEERPPSVARAAMLWVAGRRQGSHS